MDKCECVSSVIKISPVLGIERDKMGPLEILLRINDGVYVCICSVYSNILKQWTQHAFLYDSSFTTKVKSAFHGAIVDNRISAPICLLEEKYIETTKNWRIGLGSSLREISLWSMHLKLLYLTPNDI